MWHDGDRLKHEDDWGRPCLTPFRVFCGLRSPLERAAELDELTWGQQALDNTGLGASNHVDLMFDRQFVILLHREQPLVMVCRDPEAPDSPTGLSTSEGSGQTITLAERVGWWHGALDNGFWIATPEGTSDIDVTPPPAGSSASTRATPSTETALLAVMAQPKSPHGVSEGPWESHRTRDSAPPRSLTTPPGGSGTLEKPAARSGSSHEPLLCARPARRLRS